jgi:hypothetical protein
MAWEARALPDRSASPMVGAPSKKEPVIAPAL